MTQIRIWLAAALIAFVAVPVAAQEVPLKALSAYLNSFKTAQTSFTQINADGSVSTGKLYIKRPGRVRFEYDPPEKSLVLASGGQVAVFDPKSNEAPAQYPLKRTPLNLILARKVDLGRARMVIGHQTTGALTTVTAQDPKHPDYGTIQLVFSNDPIALREWIITDSAGGETKIILGDLQTGMSLGASQFSIAFEAQKRGGKTGDR